MTDELKNITQAQIFNEGDDGNTIEILYYDNKKRWGRCSGGFDSMTFITRKRKETMKDFLIRVRETAWEKYLKPTIERMAKLQ